MSTYICPTCFATKNLVRRTWDPQYKEFNNQLPKDIPCGYQGCTDRAIPMEKVNAIKLSQRRITNA